MNCQKVRRYLFSYFKRELSPEKTERIGSHLRNCPECAREAREVERINLLLKDGLETLVPSDDFNDKLLARIRSLSFEPRLSETRKWWARLLQEMFPSVRLRWALAGAVSVIIVAWVVLFTQKRISRPDSLSRVFEEKSTQMLSSSQEEDSLHLKMWTRISEPRIRRNKTFVIDNLRFSRSRGEDGWIIPERIYKRFVMERKAYPPVRKRRGNYYVLPVVSAQPASQQIDY